MPPHQQKWKFKANADPARLSILRNYTRVHLGLRLCGIPGVYRINVEQGNIIDQTKVDKLKIGMSRRQVRFILGTPMIEDSFNPDRWDYTHTVRNGKESILNQNLTVYFEGEKLSRIEGDFTPTPDEPEPETNPEPAAASTDAPETSAASASSES